MLSDDVLDNEPPPEQYRQLLNMARFRETWKLLVPTVVHEQLVEEQLLKVIQETPPRSVSERTKSADADTIAAGSQKDPARASREQKAQTATSSNKPHPFGRQGIRVFSEEGLQQVAAEIRSDDKRDRLAHFLEEASRHGGFRNIPKPRQLKTRFARLRQQFGNFAQALDVLENDYLLSLAGRAGDFRIAPLLLVGDPGLGKTYFARMLAETLGLAMESFSAGGSQAGFQICGTSLHWGNATPGMVFRLLARSEVANPILLIDEVDKITNDERQPVIPTLLDLLEPGTAQTFRDECLQLRMDASKIICLMTANNLDAVPEPLRSRAEVIEVPRPDAAQRLQIIQQCVATLIGRLHCSLELDVASAQALADEVGLDLRETDRRVRRAVAEALAGHSSRVVLEVPKAASRKRPMGFVS